MDGDEDSNGLPPLRFSIGSNSILVWNAGMENYVSDFSADEDRQAHNIQYKLTDLTQVGDFYVTVTVDTSKPYQVDGKEGEYYPQKVYFWTKEGGGLKYSGWYNKACWDSYIKDLDDSKYFYLGRTEAGVKGKFHYAKLHAYSFRLYNRALTDEEVNKNHEKSVEYHSLKEE